MSSISVSSSAPRLSSERTTGAVGTLASLFSPLRRRFTGQASRDPHRHKPSMEDEAVMGTFESFDYLPSNSEVYRSHVQTLRRDWVTRASGDGDRWVMMGLVGICVGISCFVLYAIAKGLGGFRLWVARAASRHDIIGVAWLFNVAYSCSLVALASFIVLKYAPAAQGSGVPETIGYLNGIHIPRILSARVCLVKLLSCGLVVGAGLPAGAEGAMVHLGAIIGSGVSQGVAPTLGLDSPFFRRFRNGKDKRDFLAAGAGAGIAAAFSAPIGGVLFAMEEVASHIGFRLGWQVFFCTASGVYFCNVCWSLWDATVRGGQPGQFVDDIAVKFEVREVVRAHALMLLPSVFIGAVCGAVGCLFTNINLAFLRLRIAYINPMGFRVRLLEPVFIMFLFASISTLAPLAFTCTDVDASCFVSEQGAQLQCNSREGHAWQGGHEILTELEVYNCPNAYRDRPDDNVDPDSMRYSDASDSSPDHYNQGNSTLSYNEMATLFFQSAEDTIRHLTRRGTHAEFGYTPLFVMLCVYGFFAAWAQGSAVSGGVVIPVMLTGAILGRYLGLVCVDVAEWMGAESYESEHLRREQVWAWVDPGVFALLGMGGLFAGVSRLSISLTVIAIELSNEIHLTIPMMVTIMTAKLVGDTLGIALYHGILDVKNVPFLGDAVDQDIAASADSLDIVPIKDVMNSPAVCVQEVPSIGMIKKLLRENTHNGFPVVRPSSATRQGGIDGTAGKLVGFVTRAHLLSILRHLASISTSALIGGAKGGSAPLAEDGRETDISVVRATFLPNLTYEQMSAGSQSGLGPGTVDDRGANVHETSLLAEDAAGRSGGGGGSGSLWDAHGGDVRSRDDVFIDLRAHIDTGPFSVVDSFSVARAFMIFKSIGLRHLVVTNVENFPVGIVTRKDFLPHALDRSLAAVGARDAFDL